MGTNGKKYGRQYYLKHKPHMLRQGKLWRQRHKAYALDYQRWYRRYRWKHDSQYRERRRQKNRQYNLKRRLKIYLYNKSRSTTQSYLARQKLNKALLSGRIIRPRHCELCNKNGKRLHAHHEDYSKPLEVIWMCILCHTEIHRPSCLRPRPH